MKHGKDAPNEVEIELALHRTAGNCSAAARILGCPETRVVVYTHAERAKGREIGRRGAGRPKRDLSPVSNEIVSNEIEIAIEISDEELASAPPYEPTEEERALTVLFIAHMGDELAGIV
jgi:hypothetical protein